MAAAASLRAAAAVLAALPPAAAAYQLDACSPRPTPTRPDRLDRPQPADKSGSWPIRARRGSRSGLCARRRRRRRSTAAPRTRACRGKIRSTGARRHHHAARRLLYRGRPDLPRFPGELRARAAQAWLQGEACRTRTASGRSQLGPEALLTGVTLAPYPTGSALRPGRLKPHIDVTSGRRGRPQYRTELWGCATPMRCWGLSKAERRRHQERLPARWPRSCIPTPTRTIRRRRRASPSSTPPTRLSATTTSARPSTAARSTPRASRASTASKAMARGPGAGARGGGFGPDARISSISTSVRRLHPQRRGAAGGGAGAGGFEDILREHFGGAGDAGRAAAAVRVRAGGFRRRTGQCHAALTSRCRTRRKGTTQTACSCRPARTSR